ncbi:hypothetical protein UFOVP327_38 [uncultured Caudovirales phage]|uniref:Uncharacterized protein n=1 Tax=uncultured Caudovirales phage TaxID=2100421 RepID=A0A6J5LUY7_9CAUD|nr:hypothetical protein UFOVP327_38 [uncultured Caudovirales phage]
MPTTYKVLGQSAPTANTATTLYTVPAATSTVCSSMTICNSSGANANVSVQVAVANAASSQSQFIVNNNNLISGDTLFLTLGVTLAATDTVRVTASGANVAFQIFGSEIS